MVDSARQNFLNLCSQANTHVDLAERKISAWLSSIGSGYSDAWTTHTKFLGKIGAKSKLAEDLILNAALALVPGVLGGMFGDALKITKDAAKDTFSAAVLRNKMPLVADVMIDFSAGSPTVDGLKDLAKWSLRSGAVIGASGLTIPIAAAFQKFPTDRCNARTESISGFNRSLPRSRTRSKPGRAWRTATSRSYSISIRSPP